MNKRAHILAAVFGVLLMLGTAGLTFLFGSSGGFLILFITALFIGLFGWGLPKVLKRTHIKIWIFGGLISLVGLLFPTSSLVSGYETGPFSSLNGMILFLLPSLALVCAAILLYYGLNGASSSRADNRIKVFSLMLSALLVVKTLHNFYDLTLWDNTDDPLGYLWLIIPIFVVLLSGLMLSASLSEWMKLAGPMYSIFVSMLLIAVSALAQRVDFRVETAKRAERIVQAIEAYHAREGRYPEALSKTSPWYAIPLPKPMIIHGQDWCYQSGDDYYQLGYIDRKHWSDPNLIGRVYKSVGEIPDDQGICMPEFTALQSIQPDYPFTYSEDH